MDRFTQRFDPRSLTIKDLLEARDAYHVHLARLKNVVGTAIGYYRFHPDDPGAHDPAPREAGDSNRVNLLIGSITTRLSEPSVLVFVDRHEDRAEVRPEDYIPPRLYLRDGRVVSTCRLIVEKREKRPAAPAAVRYPSRLMGGGFPCTMERQKQSRLGSIGCLVTDGNLVYALTNRHVAGEEGERMYTRATKGKVLAGLSSPRGAGKVPFTDVYPGWAGAHGVSNLDAGLVELYDINKWTAQIFRLGIMGEPIDLNMDTLNLGIIDSPLIAHGGASGIMKGRLLALFYRYHSMGGEDYIADFLIGPREEGGGELTRPGDSGTIWFYDHAELEVGDREEIGAREDGPSRQQASGEEKAPASEKSARQYRPVAMQWGGQVLGGPESSDEASFALATNLATLCRFLRIDIVRDWGLGFPEYWGKLGHFAIAQAAASLISDANLKALLDANLSRITPPLEVLTNSEVPTYGDGQFVPLADVADLVWKAYAGPDKRPAESGNHYLNLDLRAYGSFGSKYLMNLWKDEKTRLNPEYFTEFYDAAGESNHDRRGALPFRVWQIYDEMVAVLAGNAPDRITRFIAMAGIIAHYVADACMPLHNTKYFDGYDDATDEEKKVHSYIDDNILSRSQGEVLVGAFGLIDTDRPFEEVKGGEKWGQRMMALMAFTYDEVKPKKIIDTYNETIGESYSYRYEHLIEEIGDELKTCIAEGTFRLAELWHNAWQEGKGNEVPVSDLVEVPEDALSALYLDKEGFLPCHHLRDLTVNNKGKLVA